MIIKTLYDSELKVLAPKYCLFVAETETQTQIQPLRFLMLWMKLRTISTILVMLFLRGFQKLGG